MKIHTYDQTICAIFHHLKTSPNPAPSCSDSLSLIFTSPAAICPSGPSSSPPFAQNSCLWPMFPPLLLMLSKQKPRGAPLPRADIMRIFPCRFSGSTAASAPADPPPPKAAQNTSRRKAHSRQKSIGKYPGHKVDPPASAPAGPDGIRIHNPLSIFTFQESLPP
jgi:hypothetical protein